MSDKPEKPTTIVEFNARFPDDETCLEHVFRNRYGTTFECPKCNRPAHYYRVWKRRCHECEHCGHQLFATAGTPFEKTRTPLKVWFHVMFLFCASRNGVAAKEIQRQTGVTYKTAWRMGHEIRKYMAETDGDHMLGGDNPDAPIVEADKAFIGGRDRRGEDDKAIVMGVQERGGPIVTRVIEDRSSWSVEPVIQDHVKVGSKVATDEAKAFYDLAKRGYFHATVNHSEKEWARGPVHTNTVEAFWGNLKRGINGTYVWVSKQHLPKYLGEFEFRHNLRKQPRQMFERLLVSFPKPKTAGSR